MRTPAAKLYLCFCLCVFLALPVLAAAEDNFDRRHEGGHWTIYYSSRGDLLALAKQLDVYPSRDLVLSRQAEAGNLPIEVLAGAVEAIFSEVCDILDIQAPRFKGSLKICGGRRELEDIYKSHFNKGLAPTAASFYLYSPNTIYTDAANINAGILGHEMAHAVISYYFVVPPPVKIQEVLAGYAEYQLKKTGSALKQF